MSHLVDVSHLLVVYCILSGMAQVVMYVFIIIQRFASNYQLFTSSQVSGRNPKNIHVLNNTLLEICTRALLESISDKIAVSY